MKITKLNHDSATSLHEVIDKVNEIIDVLNNSFITDDPYVFYDDFGNAPLSSISCDRLTPLTNETTCDHIDNMIGGGSIYDNIKCPKCGAKYFEVGPSYCTTVYYPPIIKDGVNINPDRNTCTTEYECMECGHRWSE